MRRKGREKGRKGSRRFDSRNSSYQELKSVYSMRDTLQEKGILPTLVYFPPYEVVFKIWNAALF